jgi:hypothetical protein
MPGYYRRVGPEIAVTRGYVLLLDAIDVYMVKQMYPQAAEVRLIVQRMSGELERLGPRAAAKAEEYVRDRLRKTAVRPPTSGRLSDAVKARVIPTTFQQAAVGVGDIDILDSGAINPNAPKKGSYWRAQEYGTDAHVGRIVPGYFQPGMSAPAAGEFRNHPYFEQAGRGATGKAARGTPAMVITRPLEARFYLRDGTLEFANWRRSQVEAIYQRAITKLLAV